jgi:adenylosuccinate lyase
MDKGLERMKAYDFVQRCAMKSWNEGSDFKQNLLKDKGVSQYLSSKELDKLFDLAFYLRNVDTIYKRLGLKG